MSHTFEAIVADRFLEVPKAVVAALGGRSVRAEVAGRSFDAELVHHGGKFFLPVVGEPGTQVTVTLAG
jgi:hypothetical protein